MSFCKGVLLCLLFFTLLFRSASESISHTMSKIYGDPPLQNEFPTKCMTGLGCFETGPPFYDRLARPLILLPFDEKYINTKFLLFTSENPREPQFLTHENHVIDLSYFKPDLRTQIIVHGYGSRIKHNDSYHLIKDNILRFFDNNVIIVDWSSSNQDSPFQAIANARVVGAQIARLINTLIIHTGSSATNFHIIAHSLGASLAGFVGEKVFGLGRITALDPAAVHVKGAHHTVRLDTGDADFVDVIITNGGFNYGEGFASRDSIGHVNYYPNGGGVQPGCPKNDSSEYDLMLNQCSHERSLKLFVESILLQNCRFMGIPCKNYETYKEENCTEPSWWKNIQAESPQVTEMGFHAMKSKYIPVGQKFYLDTNKDNQFCIERDTLDWK